MTSNHGLIFGHLEASIPRLVREAHDVICRFDTVLITTLDSCWDLADSRVSSLILRKIPGSGVLGSGVVVPGWGLLVLVEDLRLFAGFDEVWCFNEPPLVPKPSDVSIVPPAAPELLNAELLRSWFEEARCVLGLGDGAGLNYVTLDVELAGVLDRAAGKDGSVPRHRTESSS